MTTPKIPTTMNEAHGFYGTMREHADAAWQIALPAIAQATATEFEAVRLFLDSRHGRHFADEVCNQMLVGLALKPAIHAAIERWMSWTIGRTISRDYGIPRGLPYLTGFVCHCEIVDEMS